MDVQHQFEGFESILGGRTSIQAAVEYAYISDGEAQK